MSQSPRRAPQALARADGLLPPRGYVPPRHDPLVLPDPPKWDQVRDAACAHVGHLHDASVLQQRMVGDESAAADLAAAAESSERRIAAAHVLSVRLARQITALVRAEQPGLGAAETDAFRASELELGIGATLERELSAVFAHLSQPAADHLGALGTDEIAPVVAQLRAEEAATAAAKADADGAAAAASAAWSDRRAVQGM